MGLTSATETAEVAAWAKQYPEVATEIEAIQTGLEAYAQTHAIAPGASVKEKLFAAINTGKAAPVVDMRSADRTTAKVYSISPAWKYAAAASIILLIGSLYLNYTFYNKYQTADKELASTQSELQQQKDLANAMHTDMGVMTDPHAMHVKLNGMADVPDATARIYWMQNTKEVYIDPSNLPKAPAGKQYEFWAIIDGKPVNGGVITTEINGKTVHVQKMKGFGAVQAFAVSLEDVGPAKVTPAKVMAAGNI
jgi:hypothetical protein